LFVNQGSDVHTQNPTAQAATNQTGRRTAGIKYQHVTPPQLAAKPPAITPWPWPIGDNPTKTTTLPSHFPEVCTTVIPYSGPSPPPCTSLWVASEKLVNQERSTPETDYVPADKRPACIPSSQTGKRPGKENKTPTSTSQRVPHATRSNYNTGYENRYRPGMRTHAAFRSLPCCPNNMPATPHQSAP